MIDIVVETICACRDDPGESVQLQVIKALLTVVSSNTCEVHGESLLLSVRACYHIYLVSRNQVNRTTAKATLTQMLNIVFQRMEVFDQRLGAESSSSLNSTPQLASDTPSTMPPPAQLLDDSVASSSVPDVPSSAPDASVTEPGAPDAAAADGAGGPVAVSVDAAAPPAVSTDLSDSGDGEGYGGTPASSGFRSPVHRDAFLLFRALCKLSMKGEEEGEESSGGLSPGPGASETIALQSKILSLELLLSVLEHSGPSFRAGSRFIEVIRQVCSMFYTIREFVRRARAVCL